MVSAALLAITGEPAAEASLFGTSPYIVTAGSVTDAVNLVLGELGSIVSSLPIIDGVEADLLPVAASALALLPGVTVTPDVAVDVMNGRPAAQTPAAVFPEATGATQLWAEGDNGSGVTVAVLDTGIDEVPDMQGRLIGGVDLSGEGNPFQDGYGHGTFVAGLIAGDGASSGGLYEGEAPGANLVSVKVAGASGVTDLATVIEGMGWTVANKARYGIRVLNLSLGYVPFLPTLLDPLDRAVESVWDAGIVAVVSAGNDGPSSGTILSPGDDPLVITVGAVNDNGQVDPTDFTMSTFSSAGPTSPDGWFKPDLVASGQSVVSLRAPGSTIDQNYPSARVGTAHFAGSGTSFSTAIVSGAAALVIADDPAITPNQVKAQLLATATPGPVGNPFVDGHGDLDVYAAATSSSPTLAQGPLPGVSTVMRATVSLFDTWETSNWNPANWQGWAPTSNGSPWQSLAWNGDGWSASAWNGSAWNGSAWNSLAWNNARWDSETWQGTAWNGAPWSSLAWNGSTWG